MKTSLYSLAFCFLSGSAAGAELTDHVPDTAVFAITPDEPLPDNYHAVFKLGNAHLTANLVIFYNHLASKSIRKGSLKEAEETLLKRSIPLSIRYGTPRTNYTCFMALAKCYADQKKYTQAKWYFIQSNLAARKARYPKGEVLSLIHLADVKKTIGDHRLALEDLKQAQKIAVAIRLKSLLPGIKKSMVALSSETKQNSASPERTGNSDKQVAGTKGSADQ